MRRPLFWFSALFLAALASSLLAEGSFGLPAACAILLFCVLLPGPRAARKGLLLTAGLACLAALGIAQGYRARMARWNAFVGQTADFSGWIREEDPYLSGRGKIQGTLRFQEDGEASPSILLDIRGLGEELTPGSWVSGRLLISQARQNGETLGGVSLYCIALGEAEEIPAPPGFHPLADMAAARWSVSQRVWRDFRDQPAAVVLAMVFSRQDLLSQAVLEQTSRAGLRHLLVVSGLHLSIAVGWILAAFRQLRRKKPMGSRGAQTGAMEEWVDGPGGQGERTGALFALAAVWILAGLAGFSLSVLRAAAMSSLWLLGMILGRRADSLTSLALAALVLTAVTPPAMLQAGFLLSFSGTLGVLLGSGPFCQGLFQLWEGRFHHTGPLSRWVLEGISVSLCAQLGTLPILAAFFGQFPVWGLFATLLAMPFAAGIILLGGAGCIFLSGGIAAPLYRVLLGMARGLGQCILLLAGFFDRLPARTVPVLLPYQLVLCLLAPAAVFGYLLLRPWIEPRRARLLHRGMALAAALICLYHIVYYRGYRGTVLISASGDTGAVVISTPGGTLVLAEGEDSYRRRMVSSQLLRCGAKAPLALVCPWDSTVNSVLWWELALSPAVTVAPEEDILLLQPPNPEDYLPLTGQPMEVLPDVFVSHPAPEITCVEVCGRKVLKFWAGYGIIAASGILSPGESLKTHREGGGDGTGSAGIIADKPIEGDLLIDMDGRMYPVSPQLRPGKMPTGDTNLLLPAGGW